MDKNITIIQIAEESGVSIATVSRVLNNTVPVSAKTKERVQKVIDKYHYTPNPLAQGLILKQTKTLGVIVPDITNPYFSTLFSEIEWAAHQSGYSVILCNTAFSAVSFASGERRKEETYFQMILDKKVDGVIIAGGQIDLCEIGDSYIEALKRLASTVPAVVIGRKLPDIPCTFVNKENDSGIVTAIRYLASLGHKRIGFVGGEREVYITESRLDAYHRTLLELKLEDAPEFVATSDYYMADGYHAALQILDCGTPVTALLAMNDNVSLGALRAISDRLLSVPGDISLVSCDRFYDGEYLTPRLTSLDRHNDLLGRHVIKLLLDKIQGLPAQDAVDFSPELVIWESSGPAHL
ncbi:LacI family transcriptional regulator [Kineothrix alysoides]|uniref:LacI family transcriptional regulator n=1 Tax=Kineothrix alysoides TaxID=1469948 RepID=A0A4R1QX55_9FIRM|nr:LacI family DNA-binding transcriptional regulator [Kineothrix alysoides]TCL55270.1 LacI family transcriptional regulator [Kineothrix alysoides]